MTARAHKVQYLINDKDLRTADIMADEMDVENGVLILFRDGQEVAIFTRCVAVIADWSDA